MCHDSFPIFDFRLAIENLFKSAIGNRQSLLSNRFNFQGRESLTVTFGALVMLASLLLEHDYLCSATVFDDGRGHLDSFDRRSAHAGFLVVVCSQHFKFYRGANFLLQGRNAHRGALFDAKLFSTCSNDCERHSLSTPVCPLTSPP